MHTWTKLATRGSVVTLLAVTALTSGGTTANADTPGCVSKKEYRKVKVATADFDGMRQRRVHTRIFNTNGTVLWRGAWQGSGPSEHREKQNMYDVCGDADGYVMVTYTAARGERWPWVAIGKWADWNG